MYLKRNIKRILAMISLVGLSQVCYLILPMLMSDIIDIGIKKNGFKDETQAFYMSAEEIIKNQTVYILKIGFLMLFITLVSVLFSVFINRIMVKISSDILFKMREDIFKKIMSLPYSKISNFPASSLITRLTADVENVQYFLITLTQLIVPPIMLVGGVIMSLKIYPSLTWIIVLGGIISGLIAFACLKIIISKTIEMQTLEDNFNLTVKEQLDGIEVIRGFGNKEFEKRRFDCSNRKFASISFFVNKVMSIMSPVLSVWANFLAVVILWICSLKVSRGEIIVGQVVAISQYSLMIIGAFVAVSLILSSIPKSMVSIKRILEILECEKEDESLLKSLQDDFKDKIEVKNLYFKYPNNSNYALRNINLKVEYGKIIGITGSVGSGKSTLLKIILGFYSPSKGSVFFGNQNLNEIKKQSILKNISYVSQKDSLFSGSLKSNLTVGFQNASDEKIKEVLKVLNLEDFSLDKNLNSNILHSGKNVSGGQKQRLTLARSLLKDANIYIFDDTFSNLDLKTEALIRSRILEILRGKTVFIVSQRIGTIKNADEIVVLNNGELIAVGSHENLSESCDVYKNMIEVQAGGDFDIAK